MTKVFFLGAVALAGFAVLASAQEEALKPVDLSGLEVLSPRPAG